MVLQAASMPDEDRVQTNFWLRVHLAPGDLRKFVQPASAAAATTFLRVLRCWALLEGLFAQSNNCYPGYILPLSGGMYLKLSRV